MPDDLSPPEPPGALLPAEAAIQRQRDRLAKMTGLGLPDGLPRTGRWIKVGRLAEWLVECGGLVNEDEQRSRYSAACNLIFAGLREGAFVTSTSRPHLVYEDVNRRFPPEATSFVERVWTDGKTRDFAGRPTIAADYLPDYVQSIWLPSMPTLTWLEARGLRSPPWLAVQAVVKPEAAEQKTPLLELGSLRPVPNRRGPDGIKRAAAVKAMTEAVRTGKVSAEQLRRMKQKELLRLYPDAGRTTLAGARKQALLLLPEAPANSGRTPANDK